MSAKRLGALLAVHFYSLRVRLCGVGFAMFGFRMAGISSGVSLHAVTIDEESSTCLKFSNEGPLSSAEPDRITPTGLEGIFPSFLRK
jgi:hypothetical protein